MQTPGSVKDLILKKEAIEEDIPHQPLACTHTTQVSTPLPTSKHTYLHLVGHVTHRRLPSYY